MTYLALAWTPQLFRGGVGGLLCPDRAQRFDNTEISFSENTTKSHLTCFALVALIAPTFDAVRQSIMF